MEYVNLHRSVMDGPEFVGAEPVDRATWFCLLHYCCGQENGGVIEACREWADRKWQQTAKVTLEEVSRESLLWKWDGDDLVVNFYPDQQEEATKRMRKGGRIGNKKRWGKHRATCPPESPPDKRASGIGESLGESITKRNETKDNETPSGKEEEKHLPESVSDELVMSFCAQFPGEPASGAPQMPTAWVADMLKRLNGRREWPMDWQRWVVALWRAEFRGWGNEKKGGAAELNPNVAAVTANQSRRRIEEELESLREQIHALRGTGEEVELEARERELQRELARLG